MALKRAVQELSEGEAVLDSVLARRLGIPVSRARDALLILASQGYDVAQRVQELSVEGQGKEEITHEEAVRARGG